MEGGRRYCALLTDDVPLGELLLLVPVALEIVRPVVATMQMSVLSDWPTLPESLTGPFARLAELGAARAPGGWIVDLDPREDEEYRLVETLGPWMICADGYGRHTDGSLRGGEFEVFTMADSGQALYFEFTDDELRRFDDEIRRLDLEPGRMRYVEPWADH
ncbi:hypothetical protein [Cryptosporangium phraense]|uniref:Uncharacterized protein n=1 Tax=Cryptosporangium phraense TaxID=2593070 RepID=A0A545B1Z6_9ACTN|nr:hypothetical protein [Cryptosporangium phraense]TQS46865.1 hypothetical protein FL583_00880 [Cryptosporangium phraense]